MVYRVISYALLPVGVILGLVTLFALFYALGTLTMLFSVFLTGATVIYIFSSFVFLQKGIDKQQGFKASLKDIIKVNAYVAVFFALLGLLQGILILLNPEATKLLLDNMKAMQPNTPQAADTVTLLKALKVVLYFMIALSVLLLFHITATFRYLRQYKDLFIPR